MRTVTFQTDPTLYNTFTVLCKLENKKIGEKISELMQDYLKNNEEKTKIMGEVPKISRRPPDFFAPRPSDWIIFCDGVDADLLIKTYNRSLFIAKYAEHEKERRIYDSDDWKTPPNAQKFDDTKEARVLKQHHVSFRETS